MTKAIASYPEHEQPGVIARRLAEETGGLGYHAAQDSKMAIIRHQIVGKYAKKVKKVANAGKGS